MDARMQILEGIRRSLGRPPLAGAGLDVVERRLHDHPSGPIPARAGPLSHPEQVALFVTMAESVAATVARVDSLDAVPGAVAAYLAGLNLPAVIRRAPDPRLDAIPWSALPTLTVNAGRAVDGDAVSLTGAVAGIAETGTLLLASGPDRPATLNFLPDTHIVVIEAGQIVGSYEQAWDRLRQAGPLPRTVNLITGPSRTADIELQVQLGAHGPRRLHIVLVETPSAEGAAGP